MSDESQVGYYYATILVDQGLVRAYVDAKNPTQLELRDWLVGEALPHCEAIAQRALHQRATGVGPWEIP